LWKVGATRHDTEVIEPKKVCAESGGNEMSLADWASVASIIQALVAIGALVAAFVGARIAWMQIKRSEMENRKWKTLDICAQYELNHDLSEAANYLRKFYFDGSQKDLDATKAAAKLVLNYLDGIAIGVEQGLYIEALAKDHLRAIVRGHVRGIFGSGRTILNEDDFEKIIAMNSKWTANETFYKAA
jgi:hypothetical protein